MKFILRVSIALALAAQASAAFATVSFTLSGRASKSNSGYEASNQTSGSGTIDLDLGRYVRIGFTHQQQYEQDNGFKVVKVGEEETFVSFRDKARVMSNSVDLTFVLYEGEIFVPYIFGGIAQKTYRVQSYREDTANTEEVNFSLFPVPTGGVGFGIRLSKEFSLRFSHRWDPGVRQSPGEESQRTLDSNSQVGISYRL